MLAEVPYLCGPFDDLPSQRLRKRDRGIDRGLSTNWSMTPRGWRVIATSPLVRALETLNLLGTPKEGREQAFAELLRAAPMLRRIDNLGAAVGNQVIALVDRPFKMVKGDLIQQ